MRLGGESGYTLVEMICVLAILTTIVGSVTGLFVAGVKAESHMNERFQAQQTARIALGKLRRDLHCATSVTAASTSRVIITYPSPTPGNCPPTEITWCTKAGTVGFDLYRIDGNSATCTGGRMWAQALTAAAAFPTYTPQSSTTLARLAVRIPVDIDPGRAPAPYELQDTIALRNSSRT